MNKNIVFALLILLPVLCFAQRRGEPQKYNETYRDQYHFSPYINKMGNPIAIWNDDNGYQLIFQYNRQNLFDGYYGWGRAVSPDLLHWEQKELVLEQNPEISDSMLHVPWWGTVSSNGKIWYNSWDEGVFMAEMNNDYTISGKEPLTVADSLFLKCEPYVFWHSPTEKWVMVAYNRPKNRMHILNSPDGLSWNETTSFNYNFGFPQLIEMPVNRRADDTRWVLVTEGGTYILGNFDGEKFEVGSTAMKFNHGRNIGGTTVLTDQKNNRHLFFTAMKSQQLADLASNGLLTFPAEAVLVEDSKGVELRLKPIADIENLFDGRTTTWLDRKIYPGISRNNLLRRVKGNELHLKGTIQNINSDLFGFLIRVDRGGRGAEISYNARRGILNLLNTQIEYTPENNKIEYEILVDRSSIEVYIDGGKYVFSTIVSQVPEAVDYILFTNGGEIMVKELEVRKMKSIWKKQ